MNTVSSSRNQFQSAAVDITPSKTMCGAGVGASVSLAVRILHIEIDRNLTALVAYSAAPQSHRPPPGGYLLAKASNLTWSDPASHAKWYSIDKLCRALCVHRRIQARNRRKSQYFRYHRTLQAAHSIRVCKRTEPPYLHSLQALASLEYVSTTPHHAEAPRNLSHSKPEALQSIYACTM